MITSTDPRDMQVDGVHEVRIIGTDYQGRQLSDWAVGLPASFADRVARTGATLRGTLLNAADVTVPANFGGYTMENVEIGDGRSIHPVDAGLSCGWHRVLAQGSYWAEQEKLPGQYNFRATKAALQAGRDKGCKTLINLAYTPSCYSSNNDAHRSTGQSASAGWAAPPTDLAATMQADPRNNSTVLRNYITALMAECGALIDAVVWWNEPNFRRYTGTGAPYGNWFDSSDTTPSDLTATASSVSGNQNYTQLVLMQACAYTTIKALRPSIVFIGPDFYGETSSQGSGGKQAGTTCFAAWLSAGGATYCDAYGWHSYTDQYQLTGIEGVDRRLASLLMGLEAQRISSSAPAKPWYCTEVGYNEYGYLARRDQLNWAARNLLIHASLGWQACINYVWDSLNASTDHMSFYLRADVPAKGLLAGVQPGAYEWDKWDRILKGSTIAAGAVQLNDGRWCGRINGVPYVV